MITLYHGSNIRIESIDLTMGQRNKDFGRGFYLTDLKDQALAMAKRRVALTGEGVPTVTTFNFDNAPEKLKQFNVLWFDAPTAEWAVFIANNRSATRTGFTHLYDLVYGPVANDSVFDQLRRFTQGRITAAELAEELKYSKLNNQYFFGTDKAVSLLTLCE